MGFVIHLWVPVNPNSVLSLDALKWEVMTKIRSIMSNCRMQFSLHWNGLFYFLMLHEADCFLICLCWKTLVTYRSLYICLTTLYILASTIVCSFCVVMLFMWFMLICSLGFQTTYCTTMLFMWFMHQPHYGLLFHMFYLDTSWIFWRH